MILHITVKAGSRKDELSVEQDGTVKVKIMEQPIEGKANKYLMKFLSKIFDVPKSKIELVKGENNPHKKVSIELEEEKGKAILRNYRIS